MMTRRGLLHSLALAASALLVRVKPQHRRSVYEVGRGKEFATIQEAMHSIWLVHGETPFADTVTITVAPGLYHEAVRMPPGLNPTDANRLVLQSAEEHHAVLVAPTGQYALHGLKNCTVSSFGVVGERGRQ